MFIRSFISSNYFVLFSMMVDLGIHSPLSYGSEGNWKTRWIWTERTNADTQALLIKPGILSYFQMYEVLNLSQLSKYRRNNNNDICHWVWSSSHQNILDGPNHNLHVYLHELYWWYEHQNDSKDTASNCVLMMVWRLLSYTWVHPFLQVFNWVEICWLWRPKHELLVFCIWYAMLW